VGCDYLLSKDRKISVNLVENLEHNVLQDSMLVLGYQHQGYQFRVPVITYSHGENPWAAAMTFSLAIAANLAAYTTLSLRPKKPMLERKEFAIAWALYEQNIGKVEAYVKENAIFLERSLNLELGRGLEIVDAYYGLDEHIMQIDAEVVRFEMPKSVKEYYDMQVVPIKKVLQIFVQNSQLSITRELFRRDTRCLFNPCVRKSDRCLLYVKYKYRGRLNAIVYEFDQDVLVIPHDIN
jgi:hypothetical protein